jgi:hypothetical protein
VTVISTIQSSQKLTLRNIGDEERPECLNCRQRGEECEWGMKITFKTGNAIELDADHASMIGPSRKRARHFKVSP